MNLILARRNGGDFRYQVHLDETKTIPDPDDATKTIPDPAYVLDRTYGAGGRAKNETAAQYTARLTAFESQHRAEMRVSCVEALAALRAPKVSGTALTGEGQTL
jgi:hypothetical protein